MAFRFVSFFSACSVDCGCMLRGAESGVSVSLVAGDFFLVGGPRGGGGEGGEFQVCTTG